MVFQESFLEAAQKKAAEKRTTPEYQEALPRRQFEQILKILSQNDFNISRKSVKDLGEQIVIKKNNEEYQAFVLNNECFLGENINKICQVNQGIELAVERLSAQKRSDRMRELMKMQVYRPSSIRKALREGEEERNDAIRRIEEDISRKKAELVKLSGAVERKLLRDIMPEFGTWVGGVAPELVEFIGAHLEMSEGHKLSKRVQKVVFSK